MKLFHLEKMHSSGNTFIICESGKNLLAKKEIQQICRDKNGVNVDGLILIEHNKLNWKLFFFNNDGSQFKMSFNGALCAAHFLLKRSNIKKVLLEIQSFGNIKASYHSGKIVLWFKMPLTTIHQTIIKINETSHRCYSVSLLDNHKIIFTKLDLLNSTEFITHAKQLRRPDPYFNEGANVHFINTSSKYVTMRHFEKGIERETMSCGSGCVATALILSKNNLVFKSPGGILQLTKECKHIWKLAGAPETQQLDRYRYI